MSEIELKAGDYVEKVSGYSFAGTVVSAFETLAGKRRMVVDNGDGLLHIFNEGQMRPATRSQSERVSRLEEALKPFAAIARHCEGEPDETVLYTHECLMGDLRLTIGDFRRARSALNRGADDGR